MASHFSRAQSGMNSLLTTYGKGDLLPHELFLSSSFPETWMDFILINDEAWAPRAERGGRGAASLERRRKRKKYQRPLMCRRSCHSGLLQGWRWHLKRFLGNYGIAPTTCWVTTVGLLSSFIPFGALDSTTTKASSTPNSSVLGQGKDFSEVASPSLSPRSSVGAP